MSFIAKINKVVAADARDSVKAIGALLVLVDELKKGVTADDILSDMYFEQEHSQNKTHLNNLKSALPQLEKLVSGLHSDISKHSVTVKI